MDLCGWTLETTVVQSFDYCNTLESLSTDARLRWNDAERRRQWRNEQGEEKMKDEFVFGH